MITRSGAYALLNIAQMLDIEDQNTLMEAIVEKHRKNKHKELGGNDIYNVALEIGLIRYREPRPVDESQTDE